LCFWNGKKKLDIELEINDMWVPTTKKGLESGFGKVRFEAPTPQEFLHSACLITTKIGLSAEIP
jgi:hypothetical protein